MTKKVLSAKKDREKICNILFKIADAKLILHSRTYKKEKMMELNELGLTERQCSSLNRRKITSRGSHAQKTAEPLLGFYYYLRFGYPGRTDVCHPAAPRPVRSHRNLPVLPDGAAEPHHDAETES